MFSNETLKTKWYSRIALLNARDAMGNLRIVNKLKRRLRMLGENV